MFLLSTSRKERPFAVSLCTRGMLEKPLLAPPSSPTSLKEEKPWSQHLALEAHQSSFLAGEFTPRGQGSVQQHGSWSSGLRCSGHFHFLSHQGRHAWTRLEHRVGSKMLHFDLNEKAVVCNGVE